MAAPALWKLGACEAGRRIARRELTAAELLRACIERVAEREPLVQAFAHVDAEAALAAAHRLDAGPLLGPLHGLPFGAKDIFDTHDQPTAHGSSLYAGSRPRADAAAVALCRAAGAVLVGKTVTTEMATYAPGPTRNPHRLTHTPGGSSSGSAAAVADGMLPLALGTQTGGSIIRPAAFCGVVGYKPSFGRVSRGGMKSGSESLDTIGGFGRCVNDAALLGAVLVGDERLWPGDASSAARAPRIGFARTPWWSDADHDSRSACESAVAELARAGAECRDITLPPWFAGLLELQAQVQAHETARSLSHEWQHHRDALSPALRTLIASGLAIAGSRHAAHLAQLHEARRRSDELFDGCDVLLAPSTVGEAPATLDSTGDPLFCRVWTLLGVPCVHLPFGTGRTGLPVGVQLIAREGEDHRLLEAARWVERRLAS